MPTVLKVLHRNLPAKALSTAAGGSDLVPPQRPGATVLDVFLVNAAACWAGFQLTRKRDALIHHHLSVPP